MVIALVFLGLVLIRVLAVSIGAALIVRPVTTCPACFRSTVPIRKGWLRLAPAYEWRWCMSCGWQGIGKRVPRRRPPAAPTPRPKWRQQRPRRSESEA